MSDNTCQVELVNITREVVGNWSGRSYWAGEEEIWVEVVLPTRSGSRGVVGGLVVILLGLLLHSS